MRLKKIKQLNELFKERGLKILVIILNLLDPRS